MDWKNAEQYDDFTAGEAMCRIMSQGIGQTDALNDRGCLLLAEAIILRAKDDYLYALRHPSRKNAGLLLEDTEAFFRSELFSRLARISGEALIRSIREEAEAE